MYFSAKAGIPLEHQQVLSILFLGRLGEIEAPSYQLLAVDYHDLVVRNGVLAVDVDRNTCVCEKSSA